MRHRDERLLGRVLKTYGDYRQAVLDHRKDVAHGRTGAGVKRYLWQSVKNFAEEFASAEHTRGQEAEADAVALLLLRRSGFNPEIGLVTAQKLDMLFGDGGAGGWQAGMTEVLCSTHPDWMERIQKTESNLNCLQFRGSLCENHITYPVENVLTHLREGMKELDEYKDRKSTRLNSSHGSISYAVFCLKKKTRTCLGNNRPASYLVNCQFLCIAISDGSVQFCIITHVHVVRHLL